MRRPVLTERTPHDPQGRQTFLVSARILDDHRLDFLWMSQSHAESHWAAVVLHEECVVIQMHLVGEVLHYLRKMIKGVRKLLVVPARRCYQTPDSPARPGDTFHS